MCDESCPQHDFTFLFRCLRQRQQAAVTQQMPWTSCNHMFFNLSAVSHRCGINVCAYVCTALRCIIHIMVACATFRAFFAASPVQSGLKSLGGLSRRRALMVQTAIFYVKHCNITQYKCIVCCMVIEGKEACCCTSSDSGNLKLDCLSGAVTTLMLMAGTFGVPVCLPPMRT